MNLLYLNISTCHLYKEKHLCLFEMHTSRSSFFAVSILFGVSRGGRGEVEKGLMMPENNVGSSSRLFALRLTDQNFKSGEGKKKAFDLLGQTKARPTDTAQNTQTERGGTYIPCTVYPTTNGGIPNGSSVGILYYLHSIACMCFCTFDTFIKSALLVGYVPGSSGLKHSQHDDQRTSCFDMYGGQFSHCKEHVL